jgi:GMP synthase (glutamine-hydrolysing)
MAIRIVNSYGQLYPENCEELTFKANEISKPFGLSSFIEPYKTSGVQGDERTYNYPVALIGKADWESIEKVSIELTNRLKQINAVDYILHPKVVRSVSIKPATLSKDRMELAREADYRVMEVVKKYELMRELYQFPVVLVPMEINNQSESVILRPIKSEEAMTAEAAFLDEKIVDEMVGELLEIDGIGSVLYRVSHKPPTTIEAG